MTKYIAFTLTVVTSTWINTSWAICSPPNKEVKEIIDEVLTVKEADFLNYEATLYKYHDMKNDISTEALVRLMSIYLGSAPGELNDCEIFIRGDSALYYLADPKYCLNSTMVKESLLSSHGADWVYEQKVNIKSKIESKNSDWCDFDN